MAIFNVKNYGAKGNGIADDRVAIQKALDAAANAGGGEVYIPTGIYTIGTGGEKPTYAGLQIRDNVTVYGDGMGQTVIKVKDGSTGGMTGIMRTPYKGSTENVTVRDLTLDGNRDHVTGKYDGWFNGYAPGEVGKDTNINLIRMEIKDCSGYGFDPHEQTEDMLIKDSVSHGNGLDGFVADFMFNGKFEGNLAYDNDRHGFNVVTSTYNFQLIDNIARDNRGGGFVVQRGTDDIPSPHDILIQGGKSYGNALEGVLIKLSDKVTVTGMEIYDNGTTGIRYFGSKNGVISDNDVYNNSQSKDGGYDEIRIEAYDDTGTRYSNSTNMPVSSGGHAGKFFNASGNRIHDNVIYSDTLIKAGWGVKEKLFSTSVPGVFDNDVINNVIYGLKNGMVQLVGVGSDQSGNTSDDGTPDPDQLIIGGPADFAHIGGSGNDTIDGMGGKDTLTGGAGHDVFKFSNLAHSVDTGSMYDRITDFNVAEDMIDVRGLGFTAFVTTGLTNAGELRLSYSASNNRSYIRSDQNDFEFYLDGDYRSTLTAANFKLDTAANINPVVNYPLIDQNGAEGTAFSYQFAPITFTDANGDALTYTAKLNNVDPLPSWLTFDPVTRTFSGTPTSTASGQYNITVIANDGHGGVVQDTFVLDIADVTVPPIDPLTGDENANNLIGTTGNDLMRGFGGLDTLTGGNGNDTLDGGAGKDTLTGGEGADVFKFSNLAHSTETELDRISDFNAAQDKIDLSGLGFTALVSGTKTNAGELRIAYSATNDRTYIRSDQSTFEFYLQGDYRTTLTSGNFIFNAVVPPANIDPLVNVPLVDQATQEGSVFSYQFAANSFTDGNGDALSYTAKLASNAALPAWLTFDGATRTFSGTPTDTASGQYNIVVTANDGKGGTASDEFIFNVADVAPANNSPAVNAPLVDQNGTEGQAFSYQFAANSFTDPDSDPLTYSAKLSNGNPLPAWLIFNAATRTFSGTPTDTASGLYAIAVAANDGKGGIVEDIFNFNVADVVTPPTDTPISGDNNANTLQGTAGNDTILGLGGNDTITGLGGNDTIDGGLGKDVMTGGEGADIFKFSGITHSLESALDRITDFDITKDKIDLTGLGFTKFVTTSGTKADELRLSYSSSGDKSLIKSDKLTFEIQLDGDFRGKLTNDHFIFSGGSTTPPPTPTVPGGSGNTITGDDTSQTLSGTPNGEFIFGLGGDDTILGGFGNDTIDGGAGKDQLTGGTDADVFAFSNLTHSTESKLDHITDFQVGVDKISLVGLGFTAFVADLVTDAGELRLAYSGATDRSYIRSDQSTFEFYLDGDYRGQLDGDDFIFS